MNHRKLPNTKTNANNQCNAVAEKQSGHSRISGYMEILICITRDASFFLRAQTWAWMNHPIHGES